MHTQKLLVATVMALALVATALPAAEPMADAMPSRAAREKMAKAHEQMAGCLRSEKPMSACQSAMKATHEAMMGEGMGMGMKMGAEKGCGKMGAPAKP